MDFYTELENVISDMPRIGLEETGKVRLMNRTDRKYLANRNLLLKFLRLTKDEYSILVASGSPVSVYSTTYWDTDDHQFYTRHHNGCRPRTKVRVRTYVDTETTFLEVKNKDNHNKTRKSRVRLASPEEMNSDDEEMFLEEKAYVSLNDIHPCLRNRFSRLTLVNKAFTERLTIDFDVNFTNLETQQEAQLGNIVIMELKRSGKSDSPAFDALIKLRIKPQGFSKYCIGTYLTNPRGEAQQIQEKRSCDEEIGMTAPKIH
ncbi:MAG: polyphosphate polymerase domain-containing protein [Bacteroidaceae bacterium]